PIAEIAPGDARELASPPAPQRAECLRLADIRSENRGTRGVLCGAERPFQITARDELRQERCIASAGVRHEVARRKHRTDGIANVGWRRRERSALHIVELSKRSFNEGGQLGAHRQEIRHPAQSLMPFDHSTRNFPGVGRG
ncbi:MAG TPA: hypothetical protein VF764_12660, partial [Steroidobacteraceae bacterium]